MKAPLQGLFYKDDGTCFFQKKPPRISTLVNTECTIYNSIKFDYPYQIKLKTHTMKTSRRSCVFVAHSNTVGHDLVFRHYTAKVVVGNYIAAHKHSSSVKTDGKKSQR